MNLTLYSVNAILILDSDGNRILAKYYQPPHLPSAPTVQSQYITTPQPNPYPTVKEQKKFEKGLFAKTKKQTADVILYDNRLVVYKQTVDATLYVVGGAEENEIMLYLVVVALRDCLDAVLKHSVDKRSIFENYDLVALCIDEICDDGYTVRTNQANRRIILETEATNICSRITKPPTTDITNVKVDLSEQGLLNAYKSVRELARERNWL